MNVYAFQLINGLGIGFIYFLLAAGLTLIFGLLGFVNFAHGAFYMVGAYIVYAITVWSGNFFISLIVAPLVLAAIGFMAHRVLLRKTYGLPHDAQILITFAIALILQEVVIIVWGPLGHNVPVPGVLSGVTVVGSFFFPDYRLFVIAISAVVALALWLGIEKTDVGARLRAGSESAEMVSLLGIDTNRLFALTVALGAALAGLAGVLSAPLRGVEPFMSHEALAIAFVVVVVGGLGTLSGALVGALLIGIVQSVMSALWPEAARLMIYGAMVLVILTRPNGLLGRA